LSNNPRIITRSELLETSFVPVPANPEAVDIMKSKGIEADKLVECGLIDLKKADDKSDEMDSDQMMSAILT
jgi:hypothetical protein